jgi:hypothetical protein
MRLTAPEIAVRDAGVADQFARNAPQGLKPRSSERHLRHD